MNTHALHVPEETLAGLKAEYLRSHEMFARAIETSPSGPLNFMFDVRSPDNEENLCHAGFQYPGPAGDNFPPDLPDTVRAATLTLWAAMMSAVSIMKLESDMAKRSRKN